MTSPTPTVHAASEPGFAPRVRDERSPQQAAEHLACDLEVHYQLLREGLASGAANLAQVKLIVRCLNELRKSRADSRLSMRRRGDGSTDIAARVPDSVAQRLKTMLESFTSPRHDAHAGDSAAGETESAGRALGSLADGAVHSRFRDPATGERLPHDRLMGEAFCSLLERFDPDRLPRHGGMTTTLVITTPLDVLIQELGIGTLPDGSHLSPGDVRRLACNARLIPAVMDGPSAVLDLGRSARLFSVDQRVALGIAHPTCQAVGCTVPSRWCEAHHRTMWSKGGRTDLADGDLLCAFHHHLVHDDSYLVEYLANGDVRFTRRR